MNKSIYVNPQTIEQLKTLEAMPSRALRVLVDDIWSRLETGEGRPLDQILADLKIDGRLISNEQRARGKKTPMPHVYVVGQRVVEGDHRGVIEGVYSVSGTIAVKWYGQDHVEVVVPQSRKVVPLGEVNHGASQLV